MLKFKNLSIRHKLTAIIVFTSGLMILITSLVLIINEAITFHRSAVRNISVLTDVIAINSTAALSFQDSQTAEELLQSLRVEPHIITAAIYNAAGNRFALYGDNKINQLPEHLELSNEPSTRAKKSKFSVTGLASPRFGSDFMDVTRLVILNEKTIGIVYVRADQGWIYERLKLFVGMVICIMLGLFVMAYFLTQKLQRVISQPIEELADTIELVTSRNDYTARVFPESSDELGTLMLGFNEMLEQIQKRDLELERVSKMKSEFLANMSHELRTPLNAIIGFSELLVGHHFGDLNETQDGYVKDIFNSGRHLLSLINDILDLSKVESGKMTLILTDVNLNSILTSSLTMIREKALKHGIEISVRIDSNIPQSFRADERKLKQVIYNLLSNAAKFTEDGGSIDLSAEMVSRTWIESRIPAIFREDCLAMLDNSCKLFCRISITDTGIGINSESILKIFAAFEQVESSASRKFGGTGLGLTLCKSLLEMHDGTIWVESVIDQGSTFTLVLPYINNHKE